MHINRPAATTFAGTVTARRPTRVPLGVACSSLAALLLFAACRGGGVPAGAPTDLYVPGLDANPQRRDDGGACTNTGPYPSGPYGTTRGSTIANLILAGTQRYGNGVPMGAMLQTRDLESYRADPTTRTLVLVVCAEWSVPCQALQPELVRSFKQHEAKGDGVSVVEAIVEKADSTPSDQSTLDKFAATYQIPFDLTLDGNAALAPFAASELYPVQLIINTCDMKIQ